MLGFNRKRPGSGLVDASGHNISSDGERKIIGLDGRQLSSATPPAAAPKGKPGQRVGIKGIVVACVCSDGFLRQLVLTTRESSKLTKFLQRLHKGKLNLQIEPSFMIVRKSKMPAGMMEALENAPSEPGKSDKNGAT